MFSTGLGRLDHILGGGLRNGMVYEVYGPPGSGKTLFLTQVAVLASAETRVLYLDTEGDYVPERAAEIAHVRGVGSFPAGIDVHRIVYPHDLVRAVLKASGYGLVVIDSLATPVLKLSEEKGPRLASRVLTALLYGLRRGVQTVLFSNHEYNGRPLREMYTSLHANYSMEFRPLAPGRFLITLVKSPGCRENEIVVRGCEAGLCED